MILMEGVMAISVEHILTEVTQLSPYDKLHLVEAILASLKQDLPAPTRQPRRSLYGLWEGVNISSEDIDEARQEMWGNFPREDI
jgi:hypothetical protein